MYVHDRRFAFLLAASKGTACGNLYGNSVFAFTTTHPFVSSLEFGAALSGGHLVETVEIYHARAVNRPPEAVYEFMA
jgi:hypothetical protein